MTKCVLCKRDKANVINGERISLRCVTTIIEPINSKCKKSVRRKNNE